MSGKIVLLNTLHGTRFDAGAENVVRLFRAGLIERGETVEVLSISPPGEPKGGGADEPAISSSSVYFPYPERPHSVPSKLVYHLLDNYNPLAVRRVAGTGVLDDARVLFTHSIRGFSTGVWTLNNRRRDLVRVHFLHEYQLICTASSMTRNSVECDGQCAPCRLLTRGKKRLSDHVDVVYGASQYVLDRHLELGLFRNAIKRVVQPPLRIEGREIRPPALGPIRRFGFYGRIVEDKGLAQLLSAFQALREGLPEQERGQAELVVAGFGKGAFFDDMVGRIAATDGARYLGTQPPEHYFGQIDALVVPSTWPDPNPLVVVEAYQHGRPVIGAYVGGVRKSVIDGQTGLHFTHDPQNAGLLAVLRQAWAGLELSHEEMRRQVEGRDLRLAVDTLLADVESCARARGQGMNRSGTAVA